MDGDAVELSRDDAAWRDKDLVLSTVDLGVADADPCVEGPKSAAATSAQQQSVRSDSLSAPV